MRLDPMGDGFAIDANDLAGLLGRSPQEVQRMMRAGSITTLFERGEDEDAGHCRVTFQDGVRRVRLIVDADGLVLRRTRTPVGAGRPG